MNKFSILTLLLLPFPLLMLWGQGEQEKPFRTCNKAGALDILYYSTSLKGNPYRGIQSHLRMYITDEWSSGVNMVYLIGHVQDQSLLDESDSPQLQYAQISFLNKWEYWTRWMQLRANFSVGWAGTYELHLDAPRDSSNKGRSWGKRPMTEKVYSKNYILLEPAVESAVRCYHGKGAEVFMIFSVGYRALWGSTAAKAGPSASHAFAGIGFSVQAAD
jgi:hypothetical protein